MGKTYKITIRFKINTRKKKIKIKNAIINYGSEEDIFSDYDPVIKTINENITENVKNDILQLDKLRPKKGWFSKS